MDTPATTKSADGESEIKKMIKKLMQTNEYISPEFQVIFQKTVQAFHDVFLNARKQIKARGRRQSPVIVL